MSYLGVWNEMSVVSQTVPTYAIVFYQELIKVPLFLLILHNGKTNDVKVWATLKELVWFVVIRGTIGVGQRG